MKIRNRKSSPEPENARQIERVILAVYLFHTVSLTATVLVLGWSLYAPLLLVIGLAAAIHIYRTQYRSYTFRACFTASMLWINLVIYGLTMDDFAGMMVTVSAIVIILAIYCVPEVFYIENAFFTFMVICRFFFLKNLSISSGHEGMRAIIRILSVYLVEGISYYFVRMQQENNRKLYDTIASLRRAEHSKDDFMANVSHEIRTPVNTICGMSEIVLQQELSDEVRGYMFGIQTAGRNLLSIVSDILDFSELESGKLAIVPDSYNITSVVNDIINMANARNSAKKLEIVVDCDAAIPSVLLGDRQKLCRAVMNILDNAVKFTEKGGVVLSISARREEYGVNLCITVSDTGVGIKPENLEKIFTSFNQADTRRSRAEGGIGLGLAISKAIVNKMGGFLNIRSTWGEGSQVHMVIPQKVMDGTPCISVKHPEDCRIAIYLHLDKYKYPLIRDSYQTAIERMARQFGVTAVFCRSLSDVKRRMEAGEVTHFFIGWEEYQEDGAYFEQMAKTVESVLIIDRTQQALHDSNLLCIYAPFYALSIASILNGETVRDISSGIHQNQFTAPDAHVLVVDDNLMNLKVVEGLLRPYRLKVSVAQSGREALEKLESRSFDFIFMDHMMPEMDGVETFRRIRQKPGAYYQSVPVIALTANAVGNAREMFLAEGFADYVSKPIEMSALEHVLHKFIPRDKLIPAGKEISAPLRKAAQGKETEKSVPEENGAFSLGGVDTRAGIGYCGGSLSDYLDILRLYYENGAQNIKKIRCAVKEKDWKQYVILTHTVKGTSGSIGAAGLSGLAARLEALGKNGCPEDMEERTEAMLAEYGRVLSAIRENKTVFPEAEKGSEATGPSKDAPRTDAANIPSADTAADEMTQEEFTDCCRKLSELCESFESDTVAKYLDTLARKSFGGLELSGLLKPVRDCVNTFDFMGAQDALAKIQGEEK